MFQFRASGSSIDVLFTRQRDIGTYIVMQSSPQPGLGAIRFQETNPTNNGGSTVFTAPHNVITEFTVQTFPSLNPFVLVCCSNNAYPKIESDPVFLCASPYDLNIIAGALDATKPAIDTGRKVAVGPSQFGPFRVGGDYKNFRVLLYEVNQRFGVGGNLFEIVGGAAVPANINFVNALAIVSVYGF